MAETAQNCDECARKEELISAMLKSAYSAKLDGNPFGAANGVIEAYKKHARRAILDKAPTA